ncbi:MAG: S41 family peptidase [Marinifilaceae bacterium]
MKKGFLMILLFIGSACIAYGQRDSREVNRQTAKYQRLMGLIDAFYVDTVNLRGLTEKAIVKVLEELDPHSVYVSKEEVDEMNEPLEGGFYGIGIQFTIMRDTLVVVQVLPNGPSAKAGLLAGDRIVAIDGERIAGVGLKNTDVRKKLKGDLGSKVDINVRRKEKEIPYAVIRDKIPIYSVNSYYMLDNKNGYIRITQFGANTVDEFEAALAALKKQGMQNLVLDLQGNGGGYMGAAIGVADHFLKNNEMIVYTDGFVGGKSEEFATAAGLMEDANVVILVDGSTASASEIVSGAIQDWDRGVIVGRRSFGKGLVQKQFPLTDGSMIRLTISHYFTPSGRCIQKPYDGPEAYSKELFNRYTNGELVSKDSIHVNNAQKFTTKNKKRVVYGGGGIIPDVFVPIDTGVNYSYLNQLVGQNVVGEYLINYIDKNRDGLKRKYPDFATYKKSFVVNDQMIEEIVVAGEKAGIKRDTKLLAHAKPTLKRQLKALIARDMWDTNEMYQILNMDDPSVKKALEILNTNQYNQILMQ